MTREEICRSFVEKIGFEINVIGYDFENCKPTKFRDDCWYDKTTGMFCCVGLDEEGTRYSIGVRIVNGWKGYSKHPRNYAKISVLNCIRRFPASIRYFYYYEINEDGSLYFGVDLVDYDPKKEETRIELYKGIYSVQYHYFKDVNDSIYITETNEKFVPVEEQTFRCHYSDWKNRYQPAGFRSKTGSYDPQSKSIEVYYKF